MKTLLILLSLGWHIAVFAAKDKGRHALIIAIGNYPAESGWPSISSLNDVPLITSALETKGFHNISTLKDIEASKKNILQAIDSLARSVNEGDLVYIHISSHGQQITDNNGDELDGLDEAIVTYYAPMNYVEGYMGEEHLRDEELGAALEKLRWCLGVRGELVVSMDACHSGTGTRSSRLSRYRGGAAPYIYHRKASSTSHPSTSTPVLACPMVVISASSAEEVNYEYGSNGSLSLAVHHAILASTDQWSYRALFSKIQVDMNRMVPYQKPTIEGDIDRYVFGGSTSEQRPFVNITEIRSEQICLNAGLIHGLTVGSKISVCRAGVTNSMDSVITHGSVLHTSGVTAEAVLLKPLHGDPHEYWVFIESVNIADVRLTLKIDSTMDAMERLRLVQQLKSFNFIDINESSAEFELKRINQNYQLWKLSSETPVMVREIEKEFSLLKNALDELIYYKTLMLLEGNNPAYRISLQLVPVEVNQEGGISEAEMGEYTNKEGQVVFKPGQYAQVKLINHSVFDVYIVVLDLQPDQRVDVLLPVSYGGDLSALRIPRNSELLVPEMVIGFSPPYGLEIFKVFATYEPFVIHHNLSRNSADFGTFLRQGLSNSRAGHWIDLSKFGTFSYAFTLEG